MIRKTIGSAVFGLLALAWGGAALAQTAFDPKPWLEDLRQARDAMSAHYANLDWAVQDRGVDLAADYPRLEAALGKAKSEAEARRLFERFLASFGDGHLRVEWPATPPAAAASPSSAAPALAARKPCDDLGFTDSWGEDRGAVGRRLPGYTPLPDSPATALFPAGLIRQDGRTVGVLRIPLFMAQWRPELCRAALAESRLPPGAPCDQFCLNALMARAEARYSDALARQLKALSAAGADVLLVDLAGNGGGSD